MRIVFSWTTCFLAIGLAGGCGAGSDANNDTAGSGSPNVMPEPAAEGATPATGALSRDAVLDARANYTVEVVSFDASQGYGAEFPYSDLVRLRITNGNDEVRLPCLTILTKRFVRGDPVGSSRAPSIPTRDLRPGQTVEYDYYPRGHLSGVSVDSFAVEIEQLIDPEVERFFCELQGAGES